MAGKSTAKAVAMEYRWLRVDRAHLHGDFVPDPSARLVFIRKLPGANTFVQLPNGSTHVIPSGHLSPHPPDEQRRILEEWGRA